MFYWFAVYGANCSGSEQTNNCSSVSHQQAMTVRSVPRCSQALFISRCNQPRFVTHCLHSTKLGSRPITGNYFLRCVAMKNRVLWIINQKNWFWISCFFPISYIVQTSYVHHYCSWLGFNTLFSCFLAGFLLFSPKESVTGCDSSLGSFCYSPVYFLSRMYLHSGYYYYDYVVIGVLRPSSFTEILF